MPPPQQPPETIFYDGHCALCHRLVRFVLQHDRSGTAFRFAPLQGRTFQEKVPLGQRPGVPASMAVETHNASLLVRSDACVHVLRRLGGGWRLIASLLAAVPRPLRDAFYNFIARIRYRVFGRRDALCPTVPPGLRQRFDP
ncbi:MAG: thiol-disulfide oxidoreductase DCC family protein [Bryobacteraceae bacterium]